MIEWRAIPGFSGYDVSDDGQVRSYHTTRRVYDVPQRTLKPWPNTDSYPTVSLRDENGKRRNLVIASLVMLAFIGSRPDHLEVCHNDGNKINNWLGNLRYDSHKNNMADCVKHGTAPVGERCGKAKLTNAQASEIRGIKDVSRRMLAKRYGVSHQAIDSIICRKSYRWIEDDLTRPT